MKNIPTSLHLKAEVHLDTSLCVRKSKLAQLQQKFRKKFPKVYFCGCIRKKKQYMLINYEKEKKKNNKNNLEWTTHLPHHPVEHKQHNTCQEICLQYKKY